MNHQKKLQPHIPIDPAVAGPLFMLSAALLLTMLNGIIKLMDPAYSVWHIGFIRFFGGVILLLAVFWRNRNPYRGNNVRLLILRGVTGSITFVLAITAIRLLPISTAMVIFYSYPAFTAIFSFLIYGEKIGLLEITSIAAIMIGVAILFDFSFSGRILGQVIALAGGVSAGLTVTLIQTLRKQNGPVIIYLYLCTMGALVTLPKFVMHPIMPATIREWAMILGIVFSSFTAQLLMTQGFFYCKGWEGGVFMSSEVIFTAIVGIVFMGDPATWRFWTGGLLVLSSVIALNRLKAGVRKTRQPKAETGLNIEK